MSTQVGYFHNSEFQIYSGAHCLKCALIDRHYEGGSGSAFRIDQLTATGDWPLKTAGKTALELAVNALTTAATKIKLCTCSVLPSVVHIVHLPQVCPKFVFTNFGGVARFNFYGDFGIGYCKLLFYIIAQKIATLLNKNNRKKDSLQPFPPIQGDWSHFKQLLQSPWKQLWSSWQLTFLPLQ